MCEHIGNVSRGSVEGSDTTLSNKICGIFRGKSNSCMADSPRGGSIVASSGLMAWHRLQLVRNLKLWLLLFAQPPGVLSTPHGQRNVQV